MKVFLSCQSFPLPLFGFISELGVTRRTMSAAPVCSFFTRGTCTRGNTCPYRHPGAEGATVRQAYAPTACKYFALLDCSETHCRFPHVALAPPVPQPTAVTVRLSVEPSKVKTYVAIDPSGANVLDDAFCLQITGTGKKRKATLELCLVNPFPKLLSLETNEGILKGAAARGQDCYSTGRSVKMLQAPLEDGRYRNVGQYCGFSDELNADAVSLTVTFAWEGGKWEIEPLGKQALCLKQIKVVRKNYASIEEDREYLEECFVLAAHYLGAAAESITASKDGGNCVNGLSASDIIYNDTSLFALKSSSRWCKGAVVVNTFKRLFDEQALQYLLTNAPSTSTLLVEEWPMATPQCDPFLPMRELKALTLGLENSVQDNNVERKYVRVPVALAPEAAVPPMFSPSLRMFAPLYNTMVLVHSVSKTEPLPFIFDDETVESQLAQVAAAVNAEARYEHQLKQQAFEEYFRAADVYVVHQRKASHPDFKKGDSARLEAVAIRTKGIEPVDNETYFRLTTVDGSLCINHTSNCVDFIAGNLSLKFTLTEVKVDKGVSRLALDLSTMQAVWSKRTKAAANFVAAVSFTRPSTKITQERFTLDGNPAERCFAKEDCYNPRCCRIHAANNIMVSYPRPVAAQEDGDLALGSAVDQLHDVSEAQAPACGESVAVVDEPVASLEIGTDSIQDPAIG